MLNDFFSKTIAAVKELRDDSSVELKTPEVEIENFERGRQLKGLSLN